MRFVSQTNTSLDKHTCEVDYKRAYGIEKLVFGNEAFYMKKFTKISYVPYTDIDRIFRRVMQLPVKIRRGSHNVDLQYLVFMKGDMQVLELQVPNKDAAVLLLDTAKKRCPQMEFVCPSK